jgi:prepilin-type N-terminal cleavage/methylation domain-containing protein
MKSCISKHASGFTIVELLVVIVVIGILASLSIVSYTGISNQSVIATMQSDLSSAYSQIKMFQVLDPAGNYPTAINCPTPSTTEVCINPSGSSAYSDYYYNNSTDPKTFKLVETNGTMKYFIQEGSAMGSYTAGLTPLSTPTISTGGATTYGVAATSDGKFVYTVDVGSNTITIFARDTNTGELTNIGSKATGGTVGRDIKISPDGKSLYVANQTSNNMSMFSRDTVTGALTNLSPLTIATGTSPHAIAISPDGKSVYVTNYALSGSLSRYSRNTTTGQLTSQGTVSTGPYPWKLAMAPDGTSLYSISINEAKIYMYSRNTTNGSLTSLGAGLATGAGALGIVASSDGKSVYALASSTSPNMIYMFDRNPSTGVLTAMTTPTVDISPATHAYDMVITPDASMVYAVDNNTSNVVMLSRNSATGELTKLDNPAISTSSGPVVIIVSSDSNSAYAIGSGIVSMYSSQ